MAETRSSCNVVSVDLYNTLSVFRDDNLMIKLSMRKRSEFRLRYGHERCTEADTLKDLFFLQQHALLGRGYALQLELFGSLFLCPHLLQDPSID